MALAIFDLDHTLLAGDSDHQWGEFLVTKGVVDEASYQKANDHFYQEYKQGTLNIIEYLEFVFLPLSQIDRSKIDLLLDEYIESRIKPIIPSQSCELVQKHHAMGHYTLIITATNSFITRPIGELFGVNALLGSDPEIINGNFTGSVSGMPCFAEGKVQRLTQFLEEMPHLKERETYFYSDSHNDLPLLKAVDFPCAVNPDEKLKMHAMEHNWPIMHTF